jgi:5-oxoprolinase (ATP-hydrolysing) subunit A
VAIDLNADLGEGAGPWRQGPVPDDDLLALVTSANVAAGFHAGDPLGIASTCAKAVQRGVAIGAHPSYDDHEGFGRRAMDVPAPLLRAWVTYQVGAVQALAASVGGRVTHVKPHGALYNAIVHDEAQAQAVVDAVAGLDRTLVLVGLPGSRVLALADDAGIPTVREAFVDRGYRPDGTLVPRGEAGALVTSPLLAGERAVRIATEGKVVAVDGSIVEVRADSLCVHSDTPGSVQIASAVRSALAAAGVEVAPFARR